MQKYLNHGKNFVQIQLLPSTILQSSRIIAQHKYAFLLEYAHFPPNILIF